MARNQSVSSSVGRWKVEVMAKVIVRSANRDDLDELVGLLELLFSIEEDFEFDARRQQQGLEMMLDHDQAAVLVAEAQGMVIGMGTGQTTISTAEGGPALLVEDVVVKETWQGQGVGRSLVAGLEEWACRRGIGRLQLLADRNNAAGLEFYRALGWQKTELICLRKRLDGP